MGELLRVYQRYLLGNAETKHPQTVALPGHPAAQAVTAERFAAHPRFDDAITSRVTAAGDAALLSPAAASAAVAAIKLLLIIMRRTVPSPDP